MNDSAIIALNFTEMDKLIMPERDG